MGFGGTLKPGKGAPFFLGRIGEDGLLRGYVCMYVEMWVWSDRYRREVGYDYTSDFIHAQCRRSGHHHNVTPLGGLRSDSLDYNATTTVQESSNTKTTPSLSHEHIALQAITSSADSIKEQKDTYCAWRHKFIVIWPMKVSPARRATRWVTPP